MKVYTHLKTNVCRDLMNLRRKSPKFAEEQKASTRRVWSTSPCCPPTPPSSAVPNLRPSPGTARRSSVSSSSPSSYKSSSCCSCLLCVSYQKERSIATLRAVPGSGYRWTESYVNHWFYFLCQFWPRSMSLFLLIISTESRIAFSILLIYLLSFWKIM